MDRIDKILVALDFSPCSVEALRQAIRLAARSKGSVLALHVIDLTPFMGVGDPLFGAGVPVVPVEPLIDAAHRRWATLVGVWAGHDRATFEVVPGIPRQQILDRVHQDRPDLLIIGAHSTEDKARSIGTTAAACVQRAACRVLVVREGQRGPFRSVLACVDFSETARTAVKEAVRAAAEDGAALHILNVYHDPWHGLDRPREVRDTMPDFDEKFRAAQEDRLREFCRPLEAEMSGLRVAYHAETCPKHSEGIIGFVRRNGCDLVALGTRAKWNFRDFFWGSTAERVVRDCPCSILAVKPAGFDYVEPYSRLQSAATADGEEVDVSTLATTGRP